MVPVVVGHVLGEIVPEVLELLRRQLQIFSQVLSQVAELLPQVPQVHVLGHEHLRGANEIVPCVPHRLQRGVRRGLVPGEIVLAVMRDDDLAARLVAILAIAGLAGLATTTVSQHVRRLANVSTPAIARKQGTVELRRQVVGLEVEGDVLHARTPARQWIEIGGVRTSATWKDPTDALLREPPQALLPFVVGAQQMKEATLAERRDGEGCCATRRRFQRKRELQSQLQFDPQMAHLGPAASRERHCASPRAW